MMQVLFQKLLSIFNYIFLLPFEFETFPIFQKKSDKHWFYNSSKDSSEHLSQDFFRNHKNSDCHRISFQNSFRKTVPTCIPEKTGKALHGLPLRIILVENFLQIFFRTCSIDFSRNSNRDFSEIFPSNILYDDFGRFPFSQFTDSSRYLSKHNIIKLAMKSFRTSPRMLANLFLRCLQAFLQVFIHEFIPKLLCGDSFRFFSINHGLLQEYFFTNIFFRNFFNIFFKIPLKISSTISAGIP